MEAKVSIIIPLFNRETLIVETLKSLYNQTHQNWEAIVVDDHSTDGSFAIVQKEAEKESRIKLYKRNSKIKGAPSCRNIGIEKAAGEFIIFLDSDDIVAPYCLEERLEFFQKKADIDFLVFNSAFFTETITDSHVLWNTFSEDNDFNRFLRGDTVWCISSPIWKRESIIKNQLRFMESAKSSQDWEFHIKALHKKMSYKKIDGLPDFFIRRSPLQSSNAISSNHGSFEKFLNRLEVFEKLFQEFPLTKKQSKNLYININNEVFNRYRKLSFRELKIVKSQIKRIENLNRFKIEAHSIWYAHLYALLKLTAGKSHQMLYYFQKYVSQETKKITYRTPMSDKMHDELLMKLNRTVVK
ncbi:MAG: glycosyltransferase family 2 protein [Aquaticitalea sp.]